MKRCEAIFSYARLRICSHKPPDDRAEVSTLLVAFKLTPAGELTTLASFDYTNGYNPSAGLIQAADGNLYGTTAGVVSTPLGTVFRLTTNGVLTTLVSFNGTNGATPLAALMQANDGNLYGSTSRLANVAVLFGLTMLLNFVLMQPRASLMANEALTTRQNR